MDTEKRSRTAIFWGVILVAAGAFLLTQTLGLVPSLSGDLIGAAFAVAGLAVLISYPALRTHWWTLIAGPTLLGLGGVILLPGDLGGAIFLGGIGVGFVLVALTSVQRWWAVIPAGTLLTLAVIALLSNALSGDLSGAVLFFGLAATFGVLAVIPVHGRLMRWPVYPALGLLVLGLLTATGGAAGSILWPLVLVALGVFLVVRASMRRAGPSGPAR
jgi:hypothetical protein